jgi:SAM-dependent methyltransferase
MDEKKIIIDWNQESYYEEKYKSFELIDSFLSCPPVRILDIGCGLAFESEHFQKKYNCELYLLDGDSNANTKDNRVRDRRYGNADSMQFYTNLDALADSYNSRGMRYYQIDANNIQINDDVIFDLVYSNLSCGFHYPISTYLNLLKKHTDQNSIMIFDMLSRTTEEQVGDLFEIIETKGLRGKKTVKTQVKIK